MDKEEIITSGEIGREIPNHQDKYFEEPVSSQGSEAETETDPEFIDMVDEAFNAMGGYGKLQKISYISNTLI